MQFHLCLITHHYVISWHILLVYYSQFSYLVNFLHLGFSPFKLVLHSVLCLCQTIKCMS